jgi:PAS domain-containing protein
VAAFVSFGIRGAATAAIPKPVVGLEHVYARQLTKELLSRNRHLETILESMAEGILEVYAGRVVYANSAAVAMLGIPAQKMLTAHPADLFQGGVRERIEALFAAIPGLPAETGVNQPLELNGRQVSCAARGDGRASS